MPAVTWSTANLIRFEDLENWVANDSHALAREQNNLINRIRRQLKTLSNKERTSLIYFIDEMIRDHFSQEKMFDQLIAEVESEKSSTQMELESCYSTNIPEYMELPNSYDPPNLSRSNKSTWSQIYAILSLNALGEAADEIEFQRSSNTREHMYKQDYMEITGAAEYLFEAFELISIAEQNSTLNSLEKIDLRNAVSEKIRMNAKNAADSRYVDQKIIKDRFIRFYIENCHKGLFKGKADAARKFYQSLSTQEQKELSKKDYEEQIYQRDQLGLPAAEVFPRVERTLKAHLKSYEDSKLLKT